MTEEYHPIDMEKKGPALKIAGKYPCGIDALKEYVANGLVDARAKNVTIRIYDGELVEPTKTPADIEERRYTKVKTVSSSVEESFKPTDSRMRIHVIDDGCGMLLDMPPGVEPGTYLPFDPSDPTDTRPVQCMRSMKHYVAQMKGMMEGEEYRRDGHLGERGIGTLAFLTYSLCMNLTSRTAPDQDFSRLSYWFGGGAYHIEDKVTELENKSPKRQHVPHQDEGLAIARELLEGKRGTVVSMYNITAGKKDEGKPDSTLDAATVVAYLERYFRNELLLSGRDATITVEEWGKVGDGPYVRQSETKINKDTVTYYYKKGYDELLRVQWKSVNAKGDRVDEEAVIFFSEHKDKSDRISLAINRVHPRENIKSLRQFQGDNILGEPYVYGYITANVVGFDEWKTGLSIEKARVVKLWTKDVKKYVVEPLKEKIRERRANLDEAIGSTDDDKQTARPAAQSQAVTGKVATLFTEASSAMDTKVRSLEQTVESIPAERDALQEDLGTIRHMLDMLREFTNHFRIQTVAFPEHERHLRVKSRVVGDVRAYQINTEHEDYKRECPTGDIARTNWQKRYLYQKVVAELFNELTGIGEEEPARGRKKQSLRLKTARARGEIAHILIDELVERIKHADL